MKKIGFITATHPSFNPGMLVCELMAKAFTDTNGLSDHSVFFRLTAMKELLRYREGADMDEILKKCDTGIPFNLLNDPLSDPRSCSIQLKNFSANTTGED